MHYSFYKPEQRDEVIALFKHSFTDSEGEHEGALIEKLVTDFLTRPVNNGDLHVFVAQDASMRIVGSIVFSRLSFPGGEKVFILAPVAVATDCHGRGIGQALINFGLEKLKELGVMVAITYGDINFYSKTGFAPISEAVIQSPLTLAYPEGWLAQSLNGKVIQPIQGKPSCLPAINNPSYW
jgi:predicted N-acetyltransferase YhbS